MASYDCVIVGSGINALVCAAMLAKKGRRVCVLERGDRFGGCIRTDEVTVPGFKHDVLSSWYPLFVTSPGYAELKDDLAGQGIEFCNSQTPTAGVLPDGRCFVLHRERARSVRAMNALAAGDGDRYQASMDELMQSLDLTFALLGGDFWTWPTAKALLGSLLRMRPHGFAQFLGQAMQSCRDWLRDNFESDELSACFAPWSAHAGMSPDATLSGHMTRLICFTLEAAGCPSVKGGSFRIVDAFRAIIEGHGGVMRLDCDADRVLSAGGRVRGVRTAGGEEFAAARAVICSVTPKQLYGRLLRDEAVPDEVREQARRFKAGRADMQIHIALDAPPAWHDPALAEVPLIHLSGGIDAVSRATNEADRGLLPEQATVVVGQPSVLDPSRCPPGKAILWLQLQELPNRVKGDAAGEIEIPADGHWSEAVREAYADRIVERVAAHVSNLKTHMLGRAVLSPADLEGLNVNLEGGDPYAGACSLDQYLLWRPLRALKNHATPLKGLYQIGASTHPGPGLGGGSGYLVAASL